MANTTLTFTSGGGSVTGGLVAKSTSGAGLAGSVDYRGQGKFYFESTMNVLAGGGIGCGLGDHIVTTAQSNGPGFVLSFTNSGGSAVIYANATNTGLTAGTALVANDVLCCAVDLTAGLIWFRKNGGAWNNSGTANPATGAGGYAYLANWPGGTIKFAGLSPYAFLFTTNDQQTLNFGDSAFAQTPPSGFGNWTVPTGLRNRASTLYAEAVTGGVPHNRVSTLYAEAVTSSSPRNRVSAFYGEMIGSGLPSKRVSALYAEVIAAPATATVVTLAATETRDRATIFMVPPMTMTLAATEQRDVAAITTLPAMNATLVANERSDTAHFVFFNGPTIKLAATEARDTASIRFAPFGFPALKPPGLGWSVHRRPTFDTIVITHESGGEVRFPLWANPLWEFELTFDGLAGDITSYPGLGINSYQNLLGMYLTVGGPRDRFLYTDPDFNSLTGQAIGIGDGATTDFPLVRSVGGFVEQISWATGVSAVTVAGVAQPFILPAPATIRLTAPPASGALVAATFTYAFVCRFLEDTLDFEEFMQNLWQLKSFKFRQVRI